MVSKSVNKGINKSFLLESKLGFTAIKDNIKDNSNLIEHYNRLEDIIEKCSNNLNNKKSNLDESDKVSQMNIISLEKYFWELRDSFLNMIKSSGMKKNELQKKIDLDETKKKNLEKKIDKKNKEIENIKQVKNDNVENEKNLKNIIAKLPDMKTKRVYSDEELLILKNVLKELENENQNDINEEIEISKNKFRLKGNTKMLLKYK